MAREWRSALGRALAVFVVLEALIAGAILFWPKFREAAPTLERLMQIPGARNIIQGFTDAGVHGYVHGQHFFKGCNTIGVAAAVLFAMGAVAGEAQRGTLEIWLARPLSRRRILLERWAQGAFAVAAPVFASTATIPWLLGFVDERMSLGGLLLGALHQSLFLLAIYSLTFLWSSLGERPGRIAAGMLFLTTFEFAIYLIQTVTHWSAFRATDIEVFNRIHSTHALPWALSGGLAALSAALVAASLAAFARRVP